jgi:hypothetical protein
LRSRRTNGSNAPPDRAAWALNGAAQIGWSHDGDGFLPPPAGEEPRERRLVAKSAIVERLNAAGLLAAAKAVLDADLYARERWYAPDKPAIYADDAEALALLAAIGADPDVILAPHAV